jgi:hypothetical protein
VTVIAEIFYQVVAFELARKILISATVMATICETNDPGRVGLLISGWSKAKGRNWADISNPHIAVKTLLDDSTTER